MAAGHRLQTRSNALIHRQCYRELRTVFRLSANLAVRAIARASQWLKEPTAMEAEPRSIDYDARTLSIKLEEATISLSTVQGRIKGVGLMLEADERQRLQGSRIVRAVLCRTSEDQYMLTMSLATEDSTE